MSVSIGSKREQISQLLEFVCADLQLTDTQYERATSAYDATLLGCQRPRARS